MKPKLSVTVDRTKSMAMVLKKLKSAKVLVGIPEDSNQRDEDGIGNAAILAINEYGSPANNIPPTPVLSTGIRLSAKDVSKEFAKAALKALDGDNAGVTACYERAGIKASVSCKNVINDQIGFEPPADATIKARQSRGFSGEKRLLVTGQVRNAITYVVKE